MARVGDEVLDAAVVQMVAQRDGMDEAAARARVQQTLRLAAAARAEVEARPGEPRPVVAEPRRAHIERAARARLWLSEVFEAAHGPDDIPAGDEILERARSEYARPRVHYLCQLLAMPAGYEDHAQRLEAAADPAWRDKAKPRFEAAAAFLRRVVVEGDPGACKFLSGLIRFETTEQDGVWLKVEQGGFDLEAKRWDAAWVEHVRRAEGPGFIAPFETQFGFHQVYVLRIAEGHDPADASTDAFVRGKALPRWRARELSDTLERLHKKRSVRSAQASP